MEILYNLSSFLEKGLRRTENLTLGAPANVEVLGLRPTEGGMRAHLKPDDPFSGAVSVTWPFPQFFRTRSKTLLCYETTVYEVDESDWSTTELTTYNMLDETVEKAITAGGTWQFVDMGKSWALFNGSCSVFKTDWFSEKALVVDGVSIQTGSFFRGRLLLGGFGSDFWSSTVDGTSWSDLWGSETELLGTWGHSLGSPEQNWVWWSRIGGGDVLHLFRPDLAQSGIPGLSSLSNIHDEDDPLWLDFLKSLQTGMMPMDWRGSVLNMLPLRDRVVVYGEDGVSIVSPASTDLSPTFGLIESSIPQGLAHRTACGGTQDQQFFIDNYGDLWTITTQGFQKLGFGEFLSPYLDEDWIITPDPREQEVILSCSSTSFVLSNNGLSESKYSVSGGGFVSGGFGATFVQQTGTKFKLQTNPFDMNAGDQKRLVSVEADYEGVSDLTLKISVRYERGGDWITLSTLYPSPEGQFLFPVMGCEFYLTLEGTFTTSTLLKALRVRFHYASDRGVRGPRFEGIQA